MNITVNTQALAQELRLLNQVAPTKSTLPVLMNVLVQADMTGLRISATDLEIALNTQCPALITEPGRTTLPAKRLLDLVEQLPDDDLQIVVDRAQVHLLSGAFRSRLQALSAEDFPPLPDATPGTSSLSVAELQAMVSRVRYAVTDKNKYALNGALLTLTEQAAVMVATDGKRLVLTSMAHSGPPASTVVPCKTLDALLTALDEPVVAFSQGERHLFFQTSKRLLVSRTIDGAFPKYEKIIPEGNGKKVVVNRVALAAALRRVGVVSGESMACYFTVGASALEVTSSSAEVGDAAEVVPVDYKGDPIKVCCNLKYVLEFLDAAAEQFVTIALKDERSPMLLTDGAHHLSVIMLMRM